MDKYAPPSGPPPGHRSGSEYSVPPDPPPGHRNEQYQYTPPPGAPPGHKGNSEQYAPPEGPPPGYQQSSNQYAPPPGPPPGHGGGSGEPAPPSYQEWMSVPDTSQLPPPPAINNALSPTSNADGTDADRAREWCRQRPLIRPQMPTEEQHWAGTGNVVLQKPREFRGSLVQTQRGRWKGSTSSDCRDACLVSALPMYFAAVDSTIASNKPATIYFELKLLSTKQRLRGDECSLAVGFCAIPYPTWRMPGWERGSLAVHSDDGRRYVSDNEGGKDFAAPFKEGEVVGIGIRFFGPYASQSSTSSSVKGALNGEAFFTRNGRPDGSWNIHEEVDAEFSSDTQGLNGTCDLYACVGAYGAISFEVIFDPRQWQYKP